MLSASFIIVSFIYFCFHFELCGNIIDYNDSRVFEATLTIFYGYILCSNGFPWYHNLSWYFMIVYINSNIIHAFNFPFGKHIAYSLGCGWMYEAFINPDKNANYWSDDEELLRICEGFIRGMISMVWMILVESFRFGCPLVSAPVGKIEEFAILSNHDDAPCQLFPFPFLPEDDTMDKIFYWICVAFHMTAMCSAVVRYNRYCRPYDRKTRNHCDRACFFTCTLLMYIAVGTLLLLLILPWYRMMFYYDKDGNIRPFGVDDGEEVKLFGKKESLETGVEYFIIAIFSAMFFMVAAIIFFCVMFCCCSCLGGSDIAFYAPLEFILDSHSDFHKQYVIRSTKKKDEFPKIDEHRNVNQIILVPIFGMLLTGGGYLVVRCAKAAIMAAIDHFGKDSN